MEKYEVYEGMLLILKKQMKYAGQETKSQFQMFESYSALDVHLIKRWYHMRPQGVKERAGNISVEDGYRDKYILKAYFPSDAKIQELNGDGGSEERKFDYDTWRVVGREIEKGQNDDEKKERYKELCSQFPFLALAFVNISKAMAGSKGDLLKNIGLCISNAADKSHVSMKEVHAGLFPSLSFCDYVLLFLCKNPDDVMKLLDCLKKENVSGENVPAISDFYLVTGVEQEFQGKPLENRKNSSMQQTSDIARYQPEFSDMVQKLEKVAVSFRMPKRAIYAIQNLMTMFLELISSSHCFDLEAVIGDMFTALDKNIDNNIKEINALIAEGYKASVQDLWKALGLFRNFVGDYLSDMQRSERFLTEGHMPVHQSIGSSTKLLLFYNRFITKVAKKLAKKENSKETYTFLVTSGGTDVTEAYDLFAHLDPAKEGNATIAVLTIPEMSLYDIRGTMLRLMHECLHFCGERKREKRYDFVLKSLSAYSAMHFCEVEKGTIWNNFEDSVFFGLKHLFSESDLDKLKRNWEEEMKDIFSEKEHNLKTFIEEIFRDNIELNIDGADYYSRYLYEFIGYVAKKKVFTVPVHDKIEDGNSAELFYRLYKDEQELQKEAAAKLADLLRREPFHLPFSNVQFLLSAAEEKSCQAETGSYDETELRFLINCMEGFMFQDMSGDHCRTGYLAKLRFDDLLGIISMLFKECYADCIAATILGADFTDIVMSIAYETWDLERAFPSNCFEKMRRKVEKDLFVSDENEFRKKMQERAENWAANGYENPACGTRDDMDKLCERLLDDSGMESYDILLRPVEEYLEDCINEFRNKILDDFKEEREIFRLASFWNPDDLGKLLDKMSNVWKECAREKADAKR